MTTIEQEVASLKEFAQHLLTRLQDLTADLTEERAERERGTRVGQVIIWAGAEVPSERYLLCDGRPLRKGDYPALFAVLGTAHGVGADETGAQVGDFNLPDYRGYFLRGVDPTGLRDPDVGERTAPRTGGNSQGGVGSVQLDQFARHAHPVHDPGHSHRYRPVVNDGGPNIAGGVGHWLTPNNHFDTSSERTGVRILDNGGEETRPKNAYVNYIIKTQ